LSTTNPKPSILKLSPPLCLKLSTSLSGVQAISEELAITIEASKLAKRKRKIFLCFLIFREVGAMKKRGK
jgi:hypothetical protein